MSERLVNSKNAARAAAALLALSAGGLEAGTAEAAPNPILNRTEKHVRLISDNVSKLLRQKSESAYQDHPLVEGRRVTRQVVTHPEAQPPGQESGRQLYDQVIIYRAPGEKQPYLMGWITGSTQKKFSVGEKLDSIFTLTRVDEQPRTYKVDYFWKQDVIKKGVKKTVPYSIHYEMSDKAGVDPHLAQKGQMLDELTSEAKDMIDMVTIESGPPPA
jgi:hypothetical protein